VADSDDMKQSTRFKAMWTAWMAGGGIIIATVVYLVTRSIGWALLGLIASGVVLNTIAQMIIQPAKAVARGRRTPPSP
jgi:hypothetical protein